VSVEAVVAICVAGGGLIVSCVSIGVAIGILNGKVSTAQRDVNNAFKMIRELQTRMEKK